MTNIANIYRIKKAEDIALIPVSEPIQLEVYLKNAEIPLQNIVGNCLIRATGCVFPNLETVQGNLSIDAADVRLPQLTFVGGYCNIHEEGIELPQLKTVKGALTILRPINLAELEAVGGSIKNKADVHLPKMKSTAKVVFVVKNMSDVALLPKDNCFALEVIGDDITIEHEEILGNITVIGKNIRFPNLRTAYKLLIGGDSRHETVSGSIFFPSLKYIEANCIVKARNISFPTLVEVKKRLLIERQGTGNFPTLEKVGTFRCESSEKIYFPNLKYIEGDFYCSDTIKETLSRTAPLIEQETFSFFNLFNNKAKKTTEKIDVKERISFPNLTYIGGNIDLTNHYQYPKLEEIKGTVHAKTAFFTFPNIKKIGTLEVYKNTNPTLFGSTFPNIETIKYALYEDKIGDLVPKIDNLFVKVLENLSVSPTDFFIESRRISWRSRDTMPNKGRNSLNMLVSILKMRHSSFQNFYTREFEREWLKPHESINEVLQAIEKKWDTSPKFTFEDIFKLTDRDLRRYCFLYIGVSEMMGALGAKRIASEGIELNYFKYDTLGNKSKFTKHNIFEVYEAQADKIQGSRGWRSDKVYAVKCWCTSTNHEHWLWIEERFKNDPLEAIASTFRIHENVIPHIKCLKRQGDVLICEMKKQVIPEGAIRPLTKKEYFKLLEAES